MLDFDYEKLIVWGVIALIVIGPKDLPRVLREVGKWVGKARALSHQFRAGFDQMVREAELAEMEKKWAEENARIMAAHPAEPVLPESQVPAQPPADPSPPAA
ncbi:MAG: Sec-independent protein translocase protein TatB [Alphaproteobacteria bacterium]|nr:Sec-independent protein translocase protein TatB [Alphaproteobacteria bacterium]MDE2042035.1 twin-arginine translocase subunit TatB [Alphaproteobacteria bacterium]MDE2341357.1 twin-arginine translocase subunit TatB [Alphaproteobacteria bacterium]